MEEKVDLLENLEVDIDESFLVSFTIIERDQVICTDRVLNHLEDLSDGRRLILNAGLWHLITILIIKYRTIL